MPPSNPTPYAIGIDIGGTNIKTVAITQSGERLSQTMERTEDDQASWLARIQSVIARIETEQNAPASAIGLSAPGLAAPDGRSIAWMQGRIGWIQGLDWTNALNVGRTVPVVNDAHAALLGEAWLGAAAGSPNVMLLTLGTGVGGGALVNGTLLRGNIGRAGHLGHISLDAEGKPDIVGTPGSLEDAIGDCTVALRSEGRFSTTEALVAAHQQGDGEATAIWTRSIYRLAVGIVSLVNVLDPEIVIVGGGIARAGDALFSPLEGFVGQMEWRPTGSRARIVGAMLGEWAGAVGAAKNALT